KRKQEGYAVEKEAVSEQELQQQQYKQVSYGFEYSKNKSAVQRAQRSPSVNQQVQMDEAVDYFKANSPESFECQYFIYVAGNYDVSLVNHLDKAEKLKPNNADVHVQKAAYNMIKENKSEAIRYVEKLKESDRLTDNVIHYAEDILLSAPENGTLITHGFDDSYATWYVQNKEHVREDVKLISLDFMQSEYYKRKLSELGYDLPESAVVDVDFLKTFCEKNTDKNLSVSLTAPKEYFKPLQDNLYVTGLVFEYHSTDFNNFQRNDFLWNETLKKHLVNNATNEKSKQLSANYLPMLLQLRRVYEQTGEEGKLKEVDEMLDKISVQSKKYEQVQQLKSATYK
ncbi:MAG: hypothetical protein JKY09_02250, partial [Crocinitomicaceae bacterium]|nr:hypothetical protein [Crocinitomicaceae bacterium]